MNKTIKIALLFLTMVIVIVVLAHVSNFEGAMRMLHGG
jgi:hypothetical protein